MGDTNLDLPCRVAEKPGATLFFSIPAGFLFRPDGDRRGASQGQNAARGRRQYQWPPGLLEMAGISGFACNLAGTSTALHLLQERKRQSESVPITRISTKRQI